jgi:hypothetical protein
MHFSCLSTARSRAEIGLNLEVGYIHSSWWFLIIWGVSIQKLLDATLASFGIGKHFVYHIRTLKTIFLNFQMVTNQSVSHRSVCNANIEFIVGIYTHVFRAKEPIKSIINTIGKLGKGRYLEFQNCSQAN